MSSSVASKSGGRVGGKIFKMAYSNTCRRTIWSRVEEQVDPEESEHPNETRGWSRYTPLYHKYKNKTENSLWENHCDFH
jgi:hypothetical protein